MNCTNCNAVLPDDAKFCMKCGAKVIQPAFQPRKAFDSTVRPVKLKLCGTCNSQANGDEMYCRRCGSLLQERWLTGKSLLVLDGASMYTNWTIVSHSKATGTLTIFEDKVYFEKKLGGSLGRAFGLVGYAIYQKKMKEDPIDEYPMAEIAEATQGKAILEGTLLTIRLKNGQSVQFINPKEKVTKAVMLIEEYRKYY